MDRELTNVLLAQYQTKTDDVRLKQQEIAGIYGFSVAAILVLLGVSIQHHTSAIICVVPVLCLFSFFLTGIRLYEMYYLRKYISHLQDEIARLLSIENLFQQTSSSFYFDQRIRAKSEKSPFLAALCYLLFFGLFISIYIGSLIRAGTVLYHIRPALGIVYSFLMITLPLVLGIAFLSGKKLMDSVEFDAIARSRSNSSSS